MRRSCFTHFYIAFESVLWWLSRDGLKKNEKKRGKNGRKKQKKEQENEIQMQTESKEFAVELFKYVLCMVAELKWLKKGKKRKIEQNSRIESEKMS